MHVTNIFIFLASLSDGHFYEQSLVLVLVTGIILLVTKHLAAISISAVVKPYITKLNSTQLLSLF
jgi:hypothetical protein